MEKTNIKPDNHCLAELLLKELAIHKNENQLHIE
jgi:hypothetical protein